MLDLFNESFRSGVCPNSWVVATILPLRKAGKPASQLASFRPISLTSCIAKTLERLIATRLQFMAESRGLISPAQAGFRSGHSCEDQILRLVQSVSDGSQATPPRKTVAALLDYSQAYDRVWRQDLLITLQEAGVPLQFLRWFAGFFHNRTAKVSFNGDYSSARPMRQGLPQGSVLAPLLFLFYINGAAAAAGPTVNIALYADDLTLWASNSNKAAAIRDLQAGVKAVAAFSKRKKLTISTGKSVVTAFSSGTSEAHWQPRLHLNSAVLPFASLG